jgi:hypothetical protein
MFENQELPIEFDGQPVKVGDQFRFIPNGIVHTVVFHQRRLRFLFELETSTEKHERHSNISSLVKDPEMWERV